MDVSCPHCSTAAFKDNYVWTLRNATHAAVGRSGEGAAVLDYLAAENLRSRRDPRHAPPSRPRRGIAELVQKHRVPVFGPRNEPIPTLTQPVSEGDRVGIPELGVSSRCSTSPATRARTWPIMGSALFCGDTLFACGCGRLFEGTGSRCSLRSRSSPRARRHQGVLRARNTRSRTSVSRKRSSPAIAR